MVNCHVARSTDVAIDAHLVDGQFSGVATCLSTHELGAVLKGMRATTIQLRLGGKRVQLETPHGLTWLSTMDPTDYPSWDILIQKLPLPRDEQVGAELTVMEFRSLAELCFAASQDDARPVFTGLYLDTQAGKLCACTADSFRLAARTMDLAGGQPGERLSMIVPARFVAAFAQQLPRNGSVRLTLLSQECLMAECDNVTAVTNLITGVYPNYRAVIPTQTMLAIRLDRMTLLGALHLARPICKESGDILRVIIQRAEDGEHWTVTLRAQEDGREFERTFLLPPSSATLFADAEEILDRLELLYNDNFLREAAEAVDNYQVELKIIDEKRPLRVVDPQDPNWCCVIMPMHKER